jgi:NADH:ubiquinone oxidoreductase subunit F (NADH-binding)
MQETRILLRNVDNIDPVSAKAYADVGGYEALRQSITSSKPEAVIEKIQNSGLRGRGGAGFPTGTKWRYAAAVESDVKYIVCNADEGEPGTNKDRVLLSGDPHSIYEGMALAGYAVGATKGYIYLRAEYPYVRDVLYKALDDARVNGYLGDNIMGSSFSFDIEIRTGAGAYVCGEETALIESIEGDRGESRCKPPYPGVAGLWGKPTVVNNVETFANVPLIVEKGASWFKSMGTDECPGTKLFTLSGNVNNKGVFEFPMGVSLRDLIYEVGGGIKDGNRLLMVQTGGSSGSVIAPENIDIPMDIEGCMANDATLGSGAILVVDNRNCVIDVLLNIMSFFAHESCGKCTPCREGTTRLYQILERIAKGQGKEKDKETLANLSLTMQVASLCGLGQAAPTAIVTSLTEFEDVYDEHIRDSFCRSGICKIVR